MIAFVAGFCLNQIRYNKLKQKSHYQEIGLEIASDIMDKHDIWDIDGSDDMADYLLIEEILKK